MILRELVAASRGCFNFGAYHASFLLALSAADATARRRFPDANVGMRFKHFLRDSMQLLTGVQDFWVAVDMPIDRSSLPLDDDGIPNLPRVGDRFYESQSEARMVLLEGVMYHAFRCALSHEADLPDVELLPPVGDGAISVCVDSKVRVSADIIVRLLSVIVSSPENRSEFKQGELR